MSIKINDEEVHGVLGYIIAVPIIVLTFLWLALTFLAMALIVCSPLILLGILIYFIAH